MGWLSALDRIREIGYQLIRRPYENSTLSVEVMVLYRSFVKAEELFDFGKKRTYNIIWFVEGVFQQVENRHAEMIERVEKHGVIAVLAMVKPVRLIDHIVIGR